MDKLKFETPDMVAGNIEKIGALFPAAITEMRGEDGQILTSGGRVLGVTAVGNDLEDAIQKAYAACAPISFQDMFFRKDIGRV